MAIIKHRPKIRVLMQPEVVAGEPASATILLEAKRPVPVEFVDAEIIGEERAKVGSGDSAQVRTFAFWHQRERLREAGELPEGVTRLQLRFELPRSSPVSQVGSRGHVQYRIVVHASIPWWPDAKRSFDMAVIPAEPNIEGRPVVFSTRADGPEGKQAHMECSLASDVLYPGAAIAGEIALSNTAFNNYRGFTVSAIAIEHCRLGRRSEDTPSQRWVARYNIEAPDDGESFAFRFRLPSKVLRSSGSTNWSVSWKIEAEARIRWAADLSLSIPVTVLPRRYSRRANDRSAPPSVGSERMRALWTEVAESSELSYDDGTLVGSWGDVAVRIHREHRGRSGPHLTATLSYQPMGIGIELVPSLRWKLIPKGLEVARDMLGRGYQVTGHDEAQVVEFLQRVQEPMKPFAEAHIFDSEARVDTRAGGATRRGLSSFIVKARALASAISDSRGALPPPGEWVDHVDAWLSVAESLGGELSAAAMSVRGAVRDVRVEIAPLWTPPSDLGDSEPISTAFTLSPARAIERGVGLELRGEPGELLDEAFSAVPELSGVAARSSLDHACALRIERDALKVELAPAIVDPSGVLSRVTSLVDLAGSLSSTGGPYR